MENGYLIFFRWTCYPGTAKAHAILTNEWEVHGEYSKNELRMLYLSLITGSATEAETFGYFLVYFHIIHLGSYDITIDLKGIINTFDNTDK